MAPVPDGRSWLDDRHLNPRAALRARLGQSGILVAPGAADAITARIVEEAGFEAVYATGAGVANASFGVPDVGLTTLTEAVAQAQRIADPETGPLG